MRRPRPGARLLLLAVVCGGQACGGSGDGQAEGPTFARDIAPIVREHCVECHRAGEIAPFPLDTFEDVRAHAPDILAAIESKRMPPWLPDRGADLFKDARVLDEAQVTRVRAWVSAGMPPGAPEPSPVQGPREEWGSRRPDLVVRFEQPFTLTPGTVDLFRNFVLPVDVSAPAYVRGVAFRWGTPGVVHHAVLGVDPSGASRRLDAADPEPGYEGMLSEDFHSPDGHFVGWTPGRRTALDTPDMAWRLDPGTDLVLQLHLLPGAAPVTIQPEIGLYLADRAPTRTPFMVKLTSTTIDIPAGSTDYAVEDSYVLPVDVDLLSVYPHAHYLARDIRARATLPTGDTRDLLTIADWNFHWQEFYRYREPVTLPRGTTVSMRVSYDNSAAHQHHPGDTPARVVYGPRSSDEMADVWLQVLPRDPADLPRLARDFVERRREARIRSAEEAIRRAPASASGYNLLATEYLGAGRTAEAIDLLREAVRRAPSSAEANNNLGAALIRAGRAADAVRFLRTAAASRPDDARIQFNLGNALRDSGSAAEAARAFDRALALDPANAEAHNNRGVLAGAAGDLATARRHFERALALNERYPEAHYNLALALASRGERPAAIAHLERALALRPGYADAAETLNELRQAGPPATQAGR